MSFVKPSLLTNVRKQYLFKLKAYYSVFTTLIVVQLLAILFSFGGVSMTGGGSNSIQVYISYYSADIVVIFTILWAFITSILITTKAYRNDDFMFVANRVSSNLSNILFLLTASLVGGITAMLSRYVLQVIMYYASDVRFVKPSFFFEAPTELLIGIGAASLYILFFSGIGYAIGSVVQLNRAFAFILPTVFIGFYILGMNSANGKYGRAVYHFIFTETSFLIFFIKMLLLTLLCFAFSIVVSNRLEVRK
ncbi:hypothetical protein DCC39_15835 [Pueribacillus theae]|uniref:Uncharacterized protein n=1 Tax=Pueribacillus theae TaxID=2171751 RepID=A0A2U1JSR0_9BACI|nr:hypothetical protein [Pueribacillus theae]PWA07913.1 hypothetical protein DCC39_15835 [Pueribacillus theae]